MRYTYLTKGTCATKISFDLEEGIVKNVEFLGGCSGNLKAIQNLVEGMKASDIIEKCDGIRCGPRSTSCANQLTIAIRAALDKS